MNILPVPVELPVVDVILKDIAAYVKDGKALDFAQLLGQRLQLVAIQEQDRQSGQSMKILGRNACQFVSAQI